MADAKYKQIADGLREQITADPGHPQRPNRRCGRALATPLVAGLARAIYSPGARNWLRRSFKSRCTSSRR
jgi:hypothetical protein